MPSGGGRGAPLSQQGDTSTQVEECPGYPNAKRLFGKQKENKRSFSSERKRRTTQEEEGNVKWETRHVLKNTCLRDVYGLDDGPRDDATFSSCLCWLFAQSNVDE